MLKALALCEAELSIHPTSAAYWQQRSYYLARLRRYQEAINSYQKTLVIAVNDPKVWCNYGSTLAAARHLREAVNAYDRALDLAPAYTSVWRRRGNTLYRMGEYARAIESYDQALALEPTDDRLWYHKGLAAYHLNDIDQARQYFNIALDNNPNHQAAHFCLIYIFAKTKNYEAVIQHLKPLLNRGWAEPSLYHFYAYALQQKGDFPQALKQLKQAVCLAPHNAQLWFHIGLISVRLKRYREAHDAFRESLKYRADHTESWLALGMTLRKLSSYEAAIAAFNKALAITPNHPLAFFHQACCYAALGNQEWAIEHLRRAIALDAATYLQKAQQEPILSFSGKQLITMS